MTFSELRSLVRSDLRRHMATGARSHWKVILLNQAFWATHAYRLCRYLSLRTRHSFLRYPSGLVTILIQKTTQILTGISLPPDCNVGAGLYIAHFGGIVIHPRVSIGSNCNLAVQIVLGFGRAKGQFGYPRLGDRVFVGPGAKILGPITIGDDAAIGANAVVVDDVPDRAVVGGIPARIINFAGSFDYVWYDGMEQDPQRIASKALASDDRIHHPGA